MAKPPRGSDLVTMLRGLVRVGSAAIDVKSQEMNRAWATSSLRPAVVEGATKLQEAVTTVIHQPQELQKNVSKSTSEAVARLSMVTEGLKVYMSRRAQPAAELPGKLDRDEDPMYDSKVEELNIEEILMQEASSGSALDGLDPSSQDGLGRVQEEANNIVDRAKVTREEITKRIEEFEPLINIAKGDEKEITQEHLQVFGKKVSELQGISHGQNCMVQEETKESYVDRNIGSFVDLQESEKHPRTITLSAESNRSQGLGTETMIMEEPMSGHQDQFLSEGQKYLYEGAKGAVDTVRKNIDEIKDEINQRVLGFEPLLDITKSEEQEITEEHLEAINKKLSELQDVSFGHDLKIIREVEDPKNVEKVVDDIAINQLSVREEMKKTALKNEEQDHKTLQKDSTEQIELHSSLGPAASNGEATAELENSISQIANPVTLDDSYNVSRISEVKVGTEGAFQVERIVSTATVSEEVSVLSSVASQSSGSTIPDGNGEATAAAVASAACSATVTPTPLVSFGSPDSRQEAKAESAKPKPKLLGRKPLAKEKPKSTLSESAQPRKVPHSRIGRLVNFGGLAAGLGMGTLAEVTRRSLGLNQGKNGGSLLDSSPFLTEANARRIVDTLCRVRGAALKLGQMLSIQDGALINPQLQKIFERVRQSADFMPTWQLEEVIRSQLGQDWRSKVATFGEKPFAAASIGQVHLATLHDGRSVAMKIQYPGVADGIESDINNLVSTLKVANIFPEGLFVDSIIEVAKRELRWECDYVREMECTRRFKELVKPYPELYVPEVIPELCTPQIFTSELIAGTPVDKCIGIDQESRNYICEQVLRVCLMELFQFGFMQTDPNWSNFFYNAETEQVALLDFGACREYGKDFVDKYINLIYGAATKDRERILKYSQDLGFLTGYEAKIMVDAHIDAIMILGEAFQESKPFNFGDQKTTYRIQNLVPVMLSHRMCAPPEESYSLHRKMSGVFLLCTKLNSVVNCHSLFHEIYRNYKFGGTWEDFHAGRL